MTPVISASPDPLPPPADGRRSGPRRPRIAASHMWCSAPPLFRGCSSTASAHEVEFFQQPAKTQTAARSACCVAMPDANARR